MQNVSLCTSNSEPFCWYICAIVWKVTVFTFPGCGTDCRQHTCSSKYSCCKALPILCLQKDASGDIQTPSLVQVKSGWLLMNIDKRQLTCD